MSDRFDIRDKCKVWDNTRTQQGVIARHGLTPASLNSSFSFTLGDPDEGRDVFTEYRRTNEEIVHYIGVDPTDQTWYNQYGRECNPGQPFKSDDFRANEAIRDNLFIRAPDFSFSEDYDAE